MRASLGQLDALIAAEGELVIRRRGEPIARVLPMTPQRRLPSHADLRQRMLPLQAPSAELIRNERDQQPYRHRDALLAEQAALQRYPMDDARFAEATNLIARYPEHPLRTLDALHLTLAADLAVSMLATADGVMADAAVSMGLQVVRF